MKFKKILTITLASMILLSGCSQTGNGKSKVEEPKLTNQEIVQKIEEKNKEFKSCKMDLKMDQDVKDLTNNKTMKSTSDINLEIIIDPLKMHMNMKMTTKDENSGQTNATPFNLETYVIDNQMYVKNEAVGDKFNKIDLNTMGINMDMYKDIAKNDQQIKYINALKDKLEVKETDDSYIISYSGNGDEITEIMKNSKEYADNPMFKEIQMNIKSFKFTSVYDKNSFFLKSSDTDMTMEMKNDKINIEMNQKMKMNASDINKIEDIKLPENVQ